MSDRSAVKRDALRAKIEASERRLANRTLADDTKEAAGAATKYVKENPMTVLGGAIVIGVVIGLMTTPGRRAAASAAKGGANAVGGAASGAARKVGTAAKSQTSKFGTLLADAMVAYGIKLIDNALDSAKIGKEKAESDEDSKS